MILPESENEYKPFKDWKPRDFQKEYADKKPAWKSLESEIKDSYSKARGAIGRSASSVECGEFRVQRRRFKYSSSQFDELDENSDSIYPRRRPRPQEDPEYYHTSPRSSVERTASRTYAAPAIDRSKLEEGYPYSRRINRHLDLDEEDDAETTSILTSTRSTYSRYSSTRHEDPDYYDFDLESSMNRYRPASSKVQRRRARAVSPIDEGTNFVPSYAPKSWERDVLSTIGKDDALKPVTPYLFVKGEQDSRYFNSGYLNSALRTPSFWAQRFESLCSGSLFNTKPASSSSREDHFNSLAQEQSEEEAFRPKREFSNTDLFVGSMGGAPGSFGASNYATPSAFSSPSSGYGSRLSDREVSPIEKRFEKMCNLSNLSGTSSVMKDRDKSPQSRFLRDRSMTPLSEDEDLLDDDKEMSPVRSIGARKSRSPMPDDD